MLKEHVGPRMVITCTHRTLYYYFDNIYYIHFSV